MVTLKNLPNYKFGIRLGANITENTTNNNYDTTYSNAATHTFTWRAGIEMQHDVSKKWTMFWGLDFFKNSINTSTDQKSFYYTYPQQYPPLFRYSFTSSTSYFYGIGPFIGVQFHLNKHLSLSTETTVYVINGTTSNNTNSYYSNGVVIYPPNSNLGSTVNQTSISLPAFVNLNFRF